jgi:uncharacterized membrane protein
VRGRNLLILRFVGQRSRLQLVKIEQKFDTISELATKLEHIQIKETDLQIKSPRKQASRF